MGDTPTSIPATLCCLSIFVLLSISSTNAFSHTHSPSRLLRIFSAHEVFVASPPTPGITASNGITVQGANGRNKLEQLARKHLNKKVVLGIVGATLAGLSILLCLLLWCLSQKHASNTQSGIIQCQPPAKQTADLGSWLRAFSSFRAAIKREKGPGYGACAVEYAVLKAATDNFSTNNLVGSGGSGRIYKARLDDGLFAAVKRLRQPSGPLKQRLQQDFQTEVELMSKIRHPNLVALLGYSKHKDDQNHLLVYEFMLNGSLEDQLHGPSRGLILNWNLRMKVALDAARGLEHLHEGCNPPIIHRDFKSSNILLDASFNAKVSDFGLAILSSDIAGDKNMELQGTFGYVAPEYLLDGILSEKSDVYAFGVVLLELITGQKPIDMSMPIGSQSLVTWASPHLADRAKLMELLDPTLQKEHVDLKHLQQVAAIAALCIQAEPSYRPLITDVVNSLVPLVPWELGGAMRSAAEPRRVRAMTTTMKAGRMSLVEFLPSPLPKCLSFSEYSLNADPYERSARFSMSARMA